MLVYCGEPRSGVMLSLLVSFLVATATAGAQAEAKPWRVDWQPVKNSTNPCFVLKESGKQVCFPSVLIAGLPKSGTSALWYMLSSHPDVVSGPAKEHCFEARQKSPSLERLLKWAEGLPKEHDKAILNGCLAFWRHPQALKRLREELGVSDFKVVQLFRDYPSWQMSHFRWLCHSCIGEDPSKCNRSARTAADFHRFLVSPACKQEHTYVNVSLRAQYEAMSTAMGGPDSYIALDQAVLLDKPKQALKQLHAFLGLRDYDYPEEVLNSVINHNDNPGFKPPKTKRKLEPGQYRTKGGEGSPMDDATHQMLADRFRPDCEWLRQTAGLCFDSCCDRDHMD